MIKIGMIGCGGVSQLHLNAIHAFKDRCVLVSAFDQDFSRAKDFAAKTTSPVLAVETIDDMLNQDLDAIIIGVPNRFHAMYATMAAERGLAVLCEKPAADSADGAYMMMETAERTGVVNMISFENRYRTGIQKLLYLVNSGALGQIFAYREICTGGRLVNPSIGMEWRMLDTMSGGGAVADFGSHSLDMSTWLLEPQCGPLVHLHGSLGTFVARDGVYPTNDDIAIITGRFASGALLSIMDSRIGPGTYQVEVLSAKAHVLYDARQSTEITVNWYQNDHPEVEWPEIPETDPFITQLDKFLSAIETHQSVQPDFRTAYKVQRFIESIRQSAF